MAPRALDGEPIELLLLGDSLAAGLGAETRKQALVGRLAMGLARRTESRDLAPQLDVLPDGYRPHVAVIVVGGNDVTHRISVAVSTAHLDATILRLHGLGARLVVGTCPDLGALRALPQPLRRLTSSMSRRLAEVQAETALRDVAEPIDLRRAVGPMFFDEPEEMFSLDRFHPSPLGYHRTAEALLPAVRRALGGVRVSSVPHRSRRLAQPGSGAGEPQPQHPLDDTGADQRGGHGQRVQEH